MEKKNQLECDHCHTFAPADATYCPNCMRWLSAAVRRQVPAAPAAANHTFQPTFYEHLGPKGTYVTSRRQLKEECNRHGLISHRLEF